MKIKQYLNESKIDNFNITERTYGDDTSNLSIGLANIHAIVPDIDANKDKISKYPNISTLIVIGSSDIQLFPLIKYLDQNDVLVFASGIPKVFEDHVDTLEIEKKTLVWKESNGRISKNVKKV